MRVVSLHRLTTVPLPLGKGDVKEKAAVPGGAGISRKGIVCTLIITGNLI